MSNFKNFMLGAALVPFSGLLAHVATALNGDNGYNSDANLSHRFECAYCINVPESHKYYTYYYDDPAYSDEGHTRGYLASPFLTYPAMLGLGVLGMRRRWYDKLKDKALGR